MRKLLLHPATKPLVFVLCLLPLVWLVVATATNQLGANPAEALIRATGDWTLRALCLVLAVTPLRVLTATPQLARFRRMLGLFVFFYGLLHLLSYSWFDMGFDLADILRDIAKRPFILVGSLALLLLALLAGTSFNRAIKALGASAGRRCTARSTRWRVWASCTSSGCVPGRTILPKWRCTPPSWRRCWAGVPGTAGAGRSPAWPPPSAGVVLQRACLSAVDRSLYI